MQAHAVRLDDAWVIPTRTEFSFCPRDRLRLDTRLCTPSLDVSPQSHRAREKWQHDSVSLCFFWHHNCPLLKHCKNIYYSTILDVLFLYSVTQLLSSALKMSRPARPPAHFLHMNELVNIQMTPQKNWHLERIDYKHLYNFMLTTEYFSSWCVGGGGFTDAGNLVWMHGEELWMDFCEDCHLLSIPSALAPSGCLLNLSPLEKRTLQINVFL